ncbi:MAG: PDZ domain-containing protein, partial [Gemmataceae bacterium]|nr:PDZ domain-containing protein [Gemmataceae bacterium]
MVMDHPTVEAISKALGPIEGIVGLSFFGKYAMTIDYQAKTMTFTPNDYEPVDMIENLMKMLLSSKNKTKVLAPGGILGITVEKAKEDEETGVVVKAVLADSAAAQAGIKAGDRLVSVDGRWTDTVTDCFAAFSLIAPATPVQAVIRRDGKEQKLQLELRPGI